MEGRDGEASSQPPVRKQPRAAVPLHTGALVPATVRGFTGWHVCGRQLWCMCATGRGPRFFSGTKDEQYKKPGTKYAPAPLESSTSRAYKHSKKQ